MKKLSALFVVCTLLFSCLSTGAAAAASDFEIEDGVLISYSGSSATVNVPEDVYMIAASAFENNTNIKNVTLPPSVRSIGDRAFYHCTALTSVTGDGVTTVGKLAFNETPYFENSTAEFFTLGQCLLWYNGTSGTVTLPSGIVSVAPYAFLRCDYLTSFKANAGLVSIGEGAFYECGALAAVSLPDTTSYIGAYAFDGTAWLSKAGEYAVLGDGILVQYKGSASDVTIPDSVRRIGPRAFVANTKIQSLKTTSSVYSRPFAAALLSQV